MRKRTATALVTLALVAAACGGSGDPESLTLVAHDSFAGGVTEETFAGFTDETGIEVEVIAAGDAGALVNQAILTKDNPLADILYGVDDTFLSRAFDDDIFEPYQSSHIDSVDPDLTDIANRVTPIDFGDVCINYDKAWFEDNGLTPPETLGEIRADLLAVEHPATSSPGLAFMLATIDEYGEEGWLDFWADLRDGGVQVATDWNAAYYGDFVRHGGDSPLVVSYASSPPAEVIFAEEPTDTAPTGVIEAGCYRQVEYVGVLRGTDHPEAAGQLVDFMLSVEFQETIPLTWFVFPANGDAELPQEFVDHAVIPDSPARMSATDIAENRERWINAWIEVMEG
jgi:thiamine transport system substrate-binding protein